MKKYEDVPERFWSFVPSRPETGCWFWKGSVGSKGYPQFRVDRRVLGAHRYAYELQVGFIPRGLCVLHKCDEPTCVRGDHLYVGTMHDNMRDREDRGRTAHGEDHPNAKLTANQVRSIRSRVDLEGIKPLAREFEVHPCTIRDIRDRRTWWRTT